jgi:hypothetical protein
MGIIASLLNYQKVAVYENCSPYLTPFIVVQYIGNSRVLYTIDQRDIPNCDASIYKKLMDGEDTEIALRSFKIIAKDQIVYFWINDHIIRSVPYEFCKEALAQIYMFITRSTGV